MLQQQHHHHPEDDDEKAEMRNNQFICPRLSMHGNSREKVYLRTGPGPGPGPGGPPQMRN